MIKLTDILKELIVEISMEQVKQQLTTPSKTLPNPLTDTQFVEVENAANHVATYAQWLGRQLVWGNIKEEDLYKYSDYFKIFKRRSKEFPTSNIFDYGYNKNSTSDAKKDISKFVSTAVRLRDEEVNDPSTMKGVDKKSKYSEYKLGEVDGYEVYKIPKGRKDLYGMSCDLGSGTEWCTATGKTRYHFDSYVKDDDLYIFTKGSEKYQFHYDSDSYMDKDDNTIL